MIVHHRKHIAHLFLVSWAVVGGVWQLMSDEKADFMNLTLYTLTLITALATPLIFLTGLFGMNFTDMDELV